MPVCNKTIKNLYTKFVNLFKKKLTPITDKNRVVFFLPSSGTLLCSVPVADSDDEAQEKLHGEKVV